ncbi:MAG: hypothetical protein HXN77_05130 [Prevotella pallens]|uniref:hypothetical protein n=1 Tax=Prevotella pallens TaxID=60133 RepID=UPI001CB56EEE|nr:hypothetical protein [Prevotella pallens]MBF1489869.1 hypothetical protein [Prevotella pallens]
MAKFDAKLALEGKPVKLRNGLKAYVDRCDLECVFAYGGYVEEEDGRRTWTRQGTEYYNLTSSHDIVSMWEDKEPETSPEVEENIFDKALKEKLPLRYTILEDNISDFYCIAKTSYGDYIVEREDNGTTYVSKLSDFENDLNWYIAELKLPKAFIPEENEEFWFIHTMKNKTVAYASYRDNDVYYNGLVSAGLAFRTKEEATQALRFLRNNIEVNNGKEQK